MLGPAGAPADCEPGYKDPDRDCENSTDQERLRQRHDRIVVLEHSSCKKDRADRQIGVGGARPASAAERPIAVRSCADESQLVDRIRHEEELKRIDPCRVVGEARRTTLDLVRVVTS